MDNAEKNADQRRFFIVGTGRSGSSLLAAVLADAGAEFSLSHREKWDPKSGAYEHPLAHEAYKWYLRARKIETSLIPDRLGAYCDRRSLRHLDTLLKSVRFVKTSTLVWLIQPARQLGYTPVIIISYRDFVGFARSRYIRFGWTLPRLAENYYESNSTALLQLDLFGGCAVSYDELINPAETRWADALAQLTGYSREGLLEARASRLTDDFKAPSPLLFDMTAFDARVTAVCDSLDSLKGKVVEPSRSRK